MSAAAVGTVRGIWIRDGLEIDGERLADICRRWHIKELSLFGSALRDDFGPESDIDLLYEFEAGHVRGWEIVDLASELESVVGRPIDLVGRGSVHWLIRDEVLAQARLLMPPDRHRT